MTRPTVDGGKGNFRKMDWQDLEPLAEKTHLKN